MKNAYLGLARLGKNSWGRYLLSAVLIFVVYMVLSWALVAAAEVVARSDGDPATYLKWQTLEFIGSDPAFGYVVFNLCAASLLVAVFVAVRVVHKRSFLTLFTPRRRLRWGRAAQGFGLFLALTAILSATYYLLTPSDLELSFDPWRFLALLPVVLVLTILQTSGEEALFRGYLLQGLGLLTRAPVLLSVATALLFVAPHLVANPVLPQVGRGLLLAVFDLFWFGVLMALVTLRDEGLELALGAHAASNLYVYLFLDYPTSGSAQISVLSYTAAESGPVGVLDAACLVGVYVVLGVAFYALVFRRKGQSTGDKS